MFQSVLRSCNITCNITTTLSPLRHTHTQKGIEECFAATDTNTTIQTAQLIVTLWLQQNIRLLLNYIAMGCGQQPGSYEARLLQAAETDGWRTHPGMDWRLVISPITLLMTVVLFFVYGSLLCLVKR